MSQNNEMVTKRDAFERLSEGIDFMDQNENKEILELLQSMTKENLEIVEKRTFYI